MDIIQCNLLVKKRRKWKSRWVVLRRVNPASERINLYVYKDRPSAISKQKEKFLFPLREFCGMESIDKENKSPKLVIITASQLLSLRFASKEDRDHWVDTIVTEGNFGEDVSYDGIVPSKHPLKSGEVTLHIYPDFFTLVRKQNCRCLGRWNFEQLFNYGTVEGGFVFRVESEADKDAEPESFLLLTSLEKQISRTFDTVYKTAHHVYGSAEGLQRSPYSNSSRGQRPRSMSEPSGFKRFMQRLSLRRRSRRPKNPKNRMDITARPSENELSSQTRAAGKLQASGNSTAELSPSALKADQPGKASVNVRQSPTVDMPGQTKNIEMSPAETEQVNGTGLFVSMESRANQMSSSHEKATNNEDLSRVGEPGRFDNLGKTATKSSQEVKLSRSSPSSTQQLQPMDSEELKIWQRRSALLLDTDLSTDDMIQRGFIKAKPPERPSSAGDLSAEKLEGNNNNNSGKKAPAPGGRTGIQVRRNTGGVGGKRPMLTIEIAPSGSEPSLSRHEYANCHGNVQYVNLPPDPIKNKHIDKLKKGEWDRYDSDENVYHHLAAVVGSPGYENLPDQSRSKSVTSLNKSYENLPSMPKGVPSYENVAGAARPSMHYVNVEGAKEKQPVNYIKVAGSSPTTPVSKNSNYPFSSRKKDTDYTVIDVEKTQQLLELKRQAKKQVERGKKS